MEKSKNYLYQTVVMFITLTLMVFVRVSANAVERVKRLQLVIILVLTVMSPVHPDIVRMQMQREVVVDLTVVVWTLKECLASVVVLRFTAGPNIPKMAFLVR